MRPIKLSFSKPGPYLAWRIASIVVIGAMAGSVLLSSYYIYQNIYRTLVDATTIVQLNASMGFENIDLEMFNKDKSLIALKKTPGTLTAHARNIFAFVSSTPLHDTTPSTTATSSLVHATSTRH